MALRSGQGPPLMDQSPMEAGPAKILCDPLCSIPTNLAALLLPSLSGTAAMTLPADLFDPRLYERARRPFLEAETLPAWCYTSEAWYAREKERLFLKSWNFLAREDEIAKPGDFLVIDMIGESILLTRDRQGSLHAFANLCRHRRTRLAEGSGNCKVITCPYHGWSFAHSGELVGVPGMEETKGFDRKDWNLLQLRLESWAGFLFVNFD